MKKKKLNFEERIEKLEDILEEKLESIFLVYPPRLKSGNVKK